MTTDNKSFPLCSSLSFEDLDNLKTKIMEAAKASRDEFYVSSKDKIDGFFSSQSIRRTIYYIFLALAIVVIGCVLLRLMRWELAMPILCILFIAFIIYSWLDIVAFTSPEYFYFLIEPPCDESDDEKFKDCPREDLKYPWTSAKVSVNGTDVFFRTGEVSLKLTEPMQNLTQRTKYVDKEAKDRYSHFRSSQSQFISFHCPSVNALVLAGDIMAKYKGADVVSKLSNGGYSFYCDGEGNKSLSKAIVNDVVSRIVDILRYWYGDAMSLKLVSNSNGITLRYSLPIEYFINNDNSVIRSRKDLDDAVLAVFERIHLSRHITEILLKLKDAVVEQVADADMPVAKVAEVAESVSSEVTESASSYVVDDNVSPEEAPASENQPSVSKLPHEMDFSQWDPLAKMKEYKFALFLKFLGSKWLYLSVLFCVGASTCYFFVKVPDSADLSEYVQHELFVFKFYCLPWILVVHCLIFSRSRRDMPMASLWAFPSAVMKYLRTKFVLPSYYSLIDGDVYAFDFRDLSKWIFGVQVSLKGNVKSDIVVKVSCSSNKSRLQIPIFENNVIRSSKFLPSSFLQKYTVVAASDDAFSCINVSEFQKLVENVTAITGDSTDVLIKIQDSNVYVLFANEKGFVSRFWNHKRHYRTLFEKWSVQNKLNAWVSQLNLL